MLSGNEQLALDKQPVSNGYKRLKIRGTIDQLQGAEPILKAVAGPAGQDLVNTILCPLAGNVQAPANAHGNNVIDRHRKPAVIS